MKILITLGAFILSFSFFYLLGSFGNADFNISHWGDYSRIHVAIFGGLFSFLISIGTYSNIFKN